MEVQPSSILHVNLDPDDIRLFREQRALDNVIRLRLVSAVIVGVVVWFAALNFAFIFAGSRELTGVPHYAALYTSYFGLNVYTLVRTFQLQRRATELPQSRHARSLLSGRGRYCERVVSGYIYLMLILAASISLADQSEYGHLMVYALTLFLTSAFLLTDAKQLAIPMIISVTFLLVGLFTRWPPGPDVMHTIQELFAYVPIAFVISRIMHGAYVDAWRSRVRLQRQILENVSLNEQLQDANRQLETLAVTDEATGIANRRGMNMHVDKMLEASGGALQLSLIMIDIDFFKAYNDRYGHEQGDHVLAAVAKALERIAADSSGFVARWGGEEFAYVATGMDREKTLGVCRRIQDEVGDVAIRHEGSKASEHVTVSQGACLMDVRNREDFAMCLRRADRALYQTKTSGRDGYTLYDDGIGMTAL